MSPEVKLNGFQNSILPRHVAIIMDGNGRWAKARQLPRAEGHKSGAQSVRRVVEETRRLGISYLTLFAFSTENWQRPAEEVNALMILFVQYLQSEIDLLLKHDIRLRSIGDEQQLPPEVQKSLQHCKQATEHCKSMQLIIAISYGARQEIVAAARRIAEKAARNEITSDQITEAYFADNLYAPDIPDPDLLIRTSDEFRISNFLLWQLAYSEIVVTPLYWPEFDEAEYHRCLAEYSGRSRRFGLTAEQIEVLGKQISN